MLVMHTAFQFIEKKRHETGEQLIKTRCDKEAVESLFIGTSLLIFLFMFSKKETFGIKI